MEKEKEQNEKIPDIISQQINQRFSQNIKLLLANDKISYNRVAKRISEHEGYSISGPYFNRLLNHPDKHSFPLPFAMQLADFFNISLDDLLSEDFDPEKAKLKAIEEKRIRLLDTGKLLKDYDNERNTNTHNIDSNKKTHIANSSDLSAFVTDPNYILFKSIPEVYYCYFYPTVSRENQSLQSILQGKLIFTKDDNALSVNLTIEPPKLNKEKEPLKKIYVGQAVYSTATCNMYCMLKNDIEYCFIIFRFFHLDNAYHDCHVAEMLSTSSATQKRYPTALRIFLSREKIASEHIRFIAPHLCLNYSRITISDSGLDVVKDKGNEYRNIINKLIQKFGSDNMYNFKEKDVLSVATEFLKREDIFRFISELRANSYAYHYTKVGDRVNESVRELLMSLGYYKDLNVT